MKSLYDRGRRFFHLLAGEAQFGTEGIISAKLLTSEATGAHLTGALGQDVKYHGITLIQLALVRQRKNFLANDTQSVLLQRNYYFLLWVTLTG